MQIPEKYIDKFTKVKRVNPWYEVVTQVAEFMNEPSLKGKWQSKLKGIPYPTLEKWMREAEKNENEFFSKQLLFNSYKKQYNGRSN